MSPNCVNLGVSTGRYRREQLNPHREPRKTIPAGRGRDEREKVAWQRGEESVHWDLLRQRRVEALRTLDLRSRSEWTELYDRQREQRRWLETDWYRGIRGRFRLWRAAGEWREFAGVMRGRPDMLRLWRDEMEQGHRYQRVQLAKAHFEDVREIERRAGEAYRSGMEGSEERAEVAARSSWSTRQNQVRYGPRVEDWRVSAYADVARLDAGAGGRRRGGLPGAAAGAGGAEAAQ